ncbi:hypothetical protein BDF20DRAFT_911558 [Mycotypha africana]|uniref:uncharacterized protein n=1 Tax=Mycotypha africana TaxID=64632 RepID=UPI002301C3A1|nr:uncharacterized protein BDF20DRAFT_911558 [Mycotypha africana]KAI8984462.1 hypothetical protein BDF20DRAFT_911558 [Mycotypha africana]
MDDLLDLNWSGSSTTNTAKQTASSSVNKPKDAFANLLSAPQKSAGDVPKLSLNEQLKRKQQPVASSNTSSPTASTSIMPLNYGTPLRSQVNLSSSTTSPKSSEPERTTKPTASSSFDSLLDPFGGSSNKKKEFDRNTPINMLRNQTVSNSNSNDRWDFDFLDTRISNTKTPTTASSSNNISTATSVSDPFEIDFLAQPGPTTTQLAMQQANLDTDDNPLGILGGPAISQMKVVEDGMQEKGGLKNTVAEDDSLSCPKGRRSAESSAEHEISVESSNAETNNRLTLLEEEEEDAALAHLIDMGFSLQQSKFAIEATAGQGIQAAIDLLVQNSEHVQRVQPRSRSNGERHQKELSGNEQARRALFHNDQRLTSSASPASVQQKTHSARCDRMLQDQQQREAGKSNNGDLHAQTEKIVSQAQELGGFLYKNAASYFKAGKDKVTKAVGDWQEQQRAHRLQQLQAEQNGPVRPKWMAGSIDDDFILNANSSQNVERFVDDKNVEEHNNGEYGSELERRRVQETRKREEMERRKQVANAHELRRQQQVRKGSLMDDKDQAYVSPSRRRGASTPNGRLTPQTKTATLSAEKSSVQLQSQPKGSPAMSMSKSSKRTRPVVNAPAEVMAKVNTARTLGNERFKLGQFGEAEDAYTQAIELLPGGHDHLVILYNNRATTRLKNGSYKNCIEDCEKAYQLAIESGDGSLTSEGVTIQWRDQITKSLYRKAEALENIEKYKAALATYEELTKYEGTNNLKVNQAMARCRQALNPKKKTMPLKNITSIKTTTTTMQNDTPSNNNNHIISMFESESKATSTLPTVSAEELNKSKAVAAMRAKAAAQEAEEAEKLEKVDNVNARLLAWKAGKEQNLRALLATLDTLLWTDAQWKGTQMSELINPKKCKITYMKAIGKVHPDKLPSTVTVEQRMLASGIFSTLNEAWDSFKTQNNL